MLVVIAIIGILAGILLPVVLQMKGKAKVQMAAKEIAELAAAIHAYEATYSRFPTVANAGSSDATFGLSNPDSNAEIIAILRATDISGKNYNKDGIRNPQKQNFLMGPRPARDTASPGIDANGVYRDPWGRPYIISMDLNYNQRVRDDFYSKPSTEDDGSGTHGLTGLVKDPEKKEGDLFVLIGDVMVWSTGPDGTYTPGAKANLSANADNIPGWK
jgi:type II secretory pathway pseudopilin PulG